MHPAALQSGASRNMNELLFGRRQGIGPSRNTTRQFQTIRKIDYRSSGGGCINSTKKAAPGSTSPVWAPMLEGARQ